MNEKIEVTQQEGNTFFIKKEGKVIGTMMLDVNYRNLAKLFEIAPDLLQVADSFRDYLGKGKWMSEFIDELFERIKDGEIE